MSSSPSDAELILGSRRGPAVFCQLYGRWPQRILAYFCRRTLDPEDCTDLVAETFSAAYERRARFRDTGKSGVAWLFGIARKELQQYRRRQRDEQVLREAIEEVAGPWPAHGSRRVAGQLSRQGWTVNRKRVVRIMSGMGLQGKTYRRKRRTTNSDHPFPRFPSLV